MASDDESASLLDGLLRAANAGDAGAKEALIAHHGDRLRRLTHKMLHHDYARLRRWEETNDIFQEAMLRLHRAVADMTMESPRHFWNVAARHIRFTLLDLSRRYFGPGGLGAHHDTDGFGRAADDERGPLRVAAEPRSRWAEFHMAIDNLSDDHREMFNLFHYQGLSRVEAARLLGVSESTVKRRWQEAKLALHDALNPDA